MAFFNEKFQRNNPDLLIEIQRSTNQRSTKGNLVEEEREMNSLREKVKQLENESHVQKQEIHILTQEVETQKNALASLQEQINRMVHSSLHQKMNTY